MMHWCLIDFASSMHVDVEFCAAFLGNWMVVLQHFALKRIANMMNAILVKNSCSFTSSLLEFCRASICNSLTGFNLPRIAFKSSLIAARWVESFARTIGALGDDGRRLYTFGRDGPDKLRATSSPGIILWLFYRLNFFLVRRIYTNKLLSKEFVIYFTVDICLHSEQMVQMMNLKYASICLPYALTEHPILHYQNHRQDLMLHRLMDRTWNSCHKMAFHSIGMAVCEPAIVPIQEALDWFRLDRFYPSPSVHWVV